MFVLKARESRVAAGGIADGPALSQKLAKDEDVLDLAVWMEWEKHKAQHLEPKREVPVPSGDVKTAVDQDDLSQGQEVSKLVNDDEEEQPVVETKSVEMVAPSKESLMEISMDATEVSESSSEWASVAENAKLLQPVTDSAKSFDFDYSKASSDFKQVSVPAGSDEMSAVPGIQFNGKVGAGSRSIVTNQPLPKPQVVTPPQVQEKIIPVTNVNNAIKRKPKGWKRMLRGSKRNLYPVNEVATSEDTPVAPPEPVEYVPFTAPFKLPDGTMSLTPRMVSYFEVEIVPNPVEESKETTEETSTVAESEETSTDDDGDEARDVEVKDVIGAYVEASKDVGKPVLEEEEKEEETGDLEVSEIEPTAVTEGEVYATPDDEMPAVEPASDIEEEEEEDAFPECIAVGLSMDGFRHNCRLPGWDSYSVGYHGDDGTVFYRRQVAQSKFGPSFVSSTKHGEAEEGCTSSGINRNIVGCGIDYRKRAVFYTLNGEFLGYAVELSEKLLAKNWYPTIGVDSRSKLVVNCGYDRPFAFDLAGHMENSESDVPIESMDKASEMTIHSVSLNENEESSKVIG